MIGLKIIVALGLVYLAFLVRSKTLYGGRVCAKGAGKYEGQCSKDALGDIVVTAGQDLDVHSAAPTADR